METPDEFPFPFPPYEIQKDFMTELYACLEKSNVGVFESPTGTGKSMSIICGALKWLVDHEDHQKNQLNSTIAELEEKLKKCTDSSKNWFSVQTEQIQLNADKQALQNKLNTILKFEDKRKKLKDVAKEKINARKNRVPANISKSAKKEGDDLPVEDSTTTEEDFESKLVIEEVLDRADSSSDEDEEEEPYENTKIFFVSRTHSQLSQFIGELKKSPYSQNVSVVTLASRQNYCINKTVQQLKHLNLINERCLELQKRKATAKEEKHLKRKKTVTRCPFMPGEQDHLIGETLTHIQQIEELVEKGKDLKTCVYYASRKSIPTSQLILAPYNLVLHKSTRISSGINLKGSILIIDEAHNLLEAIERIHCTVITGRNLLHCYSSLSQYQKRFQSLFSAQSVLSLSQLSFCLKKLLTSFGATTKSQPDDIVEGELSQKLLKIEEFEIMTGIDSLNIFELLIFIKKSRLRDKLQGYIQQHGNNVKIHQRDVKSSGVTQFLNSIKTSKTTESEQPAVAADVAKDEEQTNNPLMLILKFLESLKNSSRDGRICVVPGSTVGQSALKFLLLNPAAHFYDIVQDARSVILAGGTMAPMSEFTEQLFLAAGARPERITTFSCDHVVPQENILCNILTRGPTGIEFEFNFKNRHNTKLLDELGRTLINVCNIVPAGIVVFLPSYNFEELMYKHLKNSGVLTKISSRKRVFREPKSAAQVHETLEQYANNIANSQSPQNGSLLFSVVGGKLSEGLNFSDDLGRCVIVVGMPYPNVKSIELQEKMKYLNENVNANAGQNFYENSCMKAVNQCIGRAIRHINDYSTVIMLDKRYCQKAKALPRWIQHTLLIHNTFGSMMGATAKFFAKKKISQNPHADRKK